jgi:hypothetical protein
MRLLALCFLLLTGTAAAQQTPLAVARLVLERPLRSSPADLAACIKVGDQDPEPLLLSSLRRVRKDVVVASECTQPALLFSVSGFQVTAYPRAQVSVSTYRDGRRVADQRFELEQDRVGFWRIVSD